MEQNITISSNLKGVVKVIHAVQNDTGRELKISLDRSDLSSSMTFNAIIEKPSGLSCYIPATYDSTTNIISVELTNQALAEEGNAKAQIEVIDTDGVVTSYFFYIAIEKALRDDSTIESSNEFTALQAMENTIAQAKAQFDNAVSAVTTSTEVTDIRVKADGTTATTAGNAVREQVTALKEDLTQLEDSIYDANVEFVSYSIGGFTADGKWVSNNKRVATEIISSPSDNVIVSANSGYKFRILYYTTNDPLPQGVFSHVSDWVDGGEYKLERGYYTRLLGGYTSDAIVQNVSDFSTNITVTKYASSIKEKIADIDSRLQKIEETPLLIPIKMEVGSLSENAQKVSSTTRARTAYLDALFVPTCTKVIFDADTKHRFYIINGSNVTLTDWSEKTEDIITIPQFGNNSNIVIRMIVGYVDNRTITNDNLPKVYYKNNKEFKLGETIDSVNGYGISPSTYYSSYEASGFCISPIIPVEFGKTYRGTYIRNTNFYDENLHFVKSVAGTTVNNDFRTIDDENIKYMVFMWNADAVVNQHFDIAENFIEPMDDGSIIPFNLKGKKLSIMGDSISTFSTKIPSGYDKYYPSNNSDVSFYSQMWWQILCNKTGMIMDTVNAWSGSGVTRLTDSAHINKVPMSSDERTANLGEADIILVAGGTNDYSYARETQQIPVAWDGKTVPVEGANFTETYASMIKKIQTNYPNAIVVCASTWYTWRGTYNGYTWINEMGYTQADYDEAIKTVAKQMRVPFIDVCDIGFNRGNFYPKYASDSATIPTHTTVAGQKVMGEYLANVLPQLVKAYTDSL